MAAQDTANHKAGRCDGRLCSLGMKVVMLPWIWAPSLRAGRRNRALSGRLADFSHVLFYGVDCVDRPADHSRQRRKAFFGCPISPRSKRGWKLVRRQDARRGKTVPAGSIELRSTTRFYAPLGVFPSIKLAQKRHRHPARPTCRFSGGVAEERVIHRTASSAHLREGIMHR